MGNVKKLLHKNFYTRRRVNAAGRITLGFLLIIAVGTVLLMLPVSARDRAATPLFDALFTAVSASCVTGLVVADTYVKWSLFGQIVILAMIQLGGLGFMSVITTAFLAAGRRIGLQNRLTLAESFNLETVGGVVRLVRLVTVTAVAAEIIGAIALMFSFVPMFGWAKGVWFSIFHSVSAMCNAGFDLMGAVSEGAGMTVFAGNTAVLVPLSCLIIFGGLGFTVWNDIWHRITKGGRLSVYTRLVLFVTAVLLVGGTIVLYLTEYRNPETYGGSWLGAFFQSVTARTAGFDAAGQASLTDASKAFMVALMLVGGSAGSTAGGIKTVTAAVFVLSAAAVLRGKSEVNVFSRRISAANIRYASAAVGIAVTLVFFAGVLTSAVDSVPFIDALYEFASAYATVGLSVGVTASGGVLTRILLMIFMFFGRVGIMTIGVSFMTRLHVDSRVKYPEADILMG